MQLTTILYVILVTLVVFTVLAGLMAALSFNFPVFWLCAVVSVLSVWLLCYLEGEL